MEQRKRGRERGHSGGIAELRQLIEDHGAALDYDLMTLTRYTLRDIGGALSWGALSHFVQYVPRTSALSKEIQPTSEAELWANGNATAALLADIYDALNQLNSNVVAQSTGRRAQRVKPYKRPWEQAQGVKRLGSDPIPVSEFEDWWASEH